ncbi:YqzG/YhdC family protein [Paenibacillus guangzhouensis]|nr:YqzG/YhdC family protein [Paenibacillus guangzhouensis]
MRSKEGKEFGVYILITFDPSTEVIQPIQFGVVRIRS